MGWDDRGGGGWPGPTKHKINIHIFSSTDGGWPGGWPGGDQDREGEGGDQEAGPGGGVTTSSIDIIIETCPEAWKHEVESERNSLLHISFLRDGRRFSNCVSGTKYLFSFVMMIVFTLYKWTQLEQNLLLLTHLRRKYEGSFFIFTKVGKWDWACSSEK